MNSENFNLWLKGCEISGSKIYLLEETGDTALYQTSKTYEHQHNYYRTTSIYHVWIRGKQIAATPNYTEAYNIWAKEYKNGNERN